MVKLFDWTNPHNLSNWQKDWKRTGLAVHGLAVHLSFTSGYFFRQISQVKRFVTSSRKTEMNLVRLPSGQF